MLKINNIAPSGLPVRAKPLARRTLPRVWTPSVGTVLLKNGRGRRSSDGKLRGLIGSDLAASAPVPSRHVSLCLHVFILSRSGPEPIPPPSKEQSSIRPEASHEMR